jgi:hypothetical protein
MPELKAWKDDGNLLGNKEDYYAAFAASYLLTFLCCLISAGVPFICSSNC